MTPQPLSNTLRRAASDRLPSPLGGEGLGVRGVLVIFARDSGFPLTPNPSPPRGEGEEFLPLASRLEPLCNRHRSTSSAK